MAKIQKSDNSSVCKDNELEENDKRKPFLKGSDVRMNDYKSLQFKQQSNQLSDEDIFHETDFDDSDYIPSDQSYDSIQNSTQEMEQYVSESNDGDELPTTLKKSNKVNKKFIQLDHCKKNCHSKITLDEQKHIFETYWSLGNYSKRRLFISQMIDIENKKTATLIKSSRPRNRQYVYKYHCVKNGQKIRVCHKCFLKIYGETIQAIKTVNLHKIKQISGGLIPDDRRGKHHPPHKLSIDKYNEVILHINSIPKYESHYSRRHTNQLYFDRGLNLATLYRLYTEKYSDCVSESKYRDIFSTLDIKFKKPQLDLCNTCELFKSKIRNSVDEDEKKLLKLEQKEHHDDADFSYECKKKDKELAINSENIKMLTFDLQQCLPTPYLRAALFFYKRPLWTFNLTVHDGATKKALCYIWNETIAKRGANDIGSCIFKCLLDLPNSVRHIVLYSDSCPGQNRNSYLCAMFGKVLEDHASIQLIDHKFLVVGHTHLECDTVHAQIEKKRKNFFGSIEHSHDWANLISATNKNYIVHELRQEDFFDFRALLKDKYTWRSHSISGEKFEWKNVRWLRYEKSKPGVLQYKFSLHPEESFQTLDINSRRRKEPSPQLATSYNSPLPVSQNKKKDLLDMLPLIGTNYHSFYQNIRAEGDIPTEVHPDLDEDEGPTTVQMVSQNRPPPPPMPVPVQVPQGQVMQPYVNESGTLTHVVLSPQQYQQLHAGQGHMHPPFLTTNNTSHFYTPIPGGFPPGAGAQGPGPYQVGPHSHMAPPPQSGTPQPQQQTSSSAVNSQQQQHSPASHSANHSPSPPNNNYHKDERTQRQHTKLLRKLDKQRSAVSSPTHSPSPRRQEPQINGHNTNNNGSLRSQHNSNNHHHQRKQQPHQQQQRNGNVSNYNNRQGASSVASSEEGDDNFSLGVNGADGDEEEDYQASIVEQLSTIQKPEVTDITSRSAKIVWEAPQCISESAIQLINMRELRYNVLLSDRAKECKYKSLYKGSSYDCIVQDLKPGQEYVVRLQVHYEHLHGTASEPTEFTTPACEPDRPVAPRMVMCTKNSLHLRWNNPLCNGSSIQHYLLEYDEGKTGARVANEAACKFVEAVKTKGKQYIMTKLQPSTIYNFRLAAVNEVGPSAYSPVCTFSTQGNPPSAPKPPTLQAFNSSSLRLVWERRQSDGATCIYVLQMLDRTSGHGYLNMYNGPDSSYECCQLRRATLYYFRLRAENEAGASAWSNEVAYKTAPERPGRPGKPYAKGKIHGTHFRVRWEPTSDNGGAEIQRYYLEINAIGQKFDRIYTGVECEATCDRLQPGTTYQLRASCEGPGGLSPYSEVSHITSEAVVPAAPPSPYYDNPPGPYAAVLRLDKPDYNGGAPVLEFELQLRKVAEQETPRIVYRGKDAYCVIKDLHPGNQYDVQVRAINRIGAGSWSPWFKFSSAAAAPNCPESLKVIIKSATQLHVSWQEPSNKGGAPIAEYRLESATALNASELVTPQPPPSSAFHTCYQGLQTSTDIRNLMPFTYYYFRVNACNLAGVSKWSPLVNCQTPAAVPSAPQIKDLEFTSNEATLHWSSPESNGSDITNYTIEYAERTIMTSDNATEYTVTNLHPETSYKFRVQAINAIGSGPYSLYAKLTTLPSPPSPPKLECSGVGHNFIKLKWGDGKNVDFTKFYVEMFVQRAKEFQVVYSGTNCMCKVNKLQERTAYTFRICAGNDRAGVGEYSEDFLFSTSACLPNSIKAPRIAQNLPTAAYSTTTASSNGNSGSSPSATTSAGVIPSGLLPETPSFLTGLGNLMLGVPLTLEWQHSKNSFSDRVEYMLQYAIGKDGEFKKIYRGNETKFTIENLEPGGIYQFRVCPIRVTNNGEDLVGAYTSPFRHQVPLIPSLDDIDGNLLGNAAAQMFAGLNAASGNNSHASGSCHGHSHHHTHHSHIGGHSHQHNPLHSHHNSRHSGHHNNGSSGSNDSNANTNLHHRSVSASAGSSSSSSQSSSIKNQNSNANNTPSNNTLLIGSNAIGFIPIGSMASELAASFANCDDPNHHHHHHVFPDVANQLHSTASSSGSSNSSNNPQSAASLLAASANQLFANNPILLQAATAAISHHQHVLGHHHGGGAHNQNAGALRRFVTKLSSVYSNRKRFSDQEKAVIFMVSFLFFTFLFATLVKMFMR